MDEYIVVDIETTGLSKYMHKITEIAAVKVNKGKVVGEYQTLVNPGGHIPSFITRLTGISDEMVKDAPKIKEVLPEFLDFLGEHPMVAHNATFDFGFLNYSAERILKTIMNNKKVCTRRLASRILPDLPSKRLSSICKHFKVKNNQAHRAMSDVKATNEVFVKFIKSLKKAGIEGDEVYKFSVSPRYKCEQLMKKQKTK
ncbi:MAG: 3'-5' exonuclease [Nanoarchaeota archaeon]|nr:3'-5' exonuclease [Nanoarchaeota archaeon]MBU1031051.1 3'-5' exonuclease [Nanoarchaeota archaeon]MBU1850095.1 3'-5' exonuclease [Nanoarchaeota archaeon]